MVECVVRQMGTICIYKIICKLLIMINYDSLGNSLYKFQLPTNNCTLTFPPFIDTYRQIHLIHTNALFRTSGYMGIQNEINTTKSGRGSTKWIIHQSPAVQSSWWWKDPLLGGYFVVFHCTLSHNHRMATFRKVTLIEDTPIFHFHVDTGKGTSNNPGPEPTTCCLYVCVCVCVLISLFF